MSKLAQLAAFLRTKSDCFSYCMYASGPLDKCGTLACAAGWATVLWPESLRLIFVDNAVEINGNDSIGELCNFFGLCEELCCALFLPNSFSPVLNKEGPRGGATADQVADWIMEHVEALKL